MEGVMLDVIKLLFTMLRSQIANKKITAAEYMICSPVVVMCQASLMVCQLGRNAFECQRTDVIRYQGRQNEDRESSREQA